MPHSKRFACLAAIVASSAISARAVTFNIDAEVLADQFGVPMVSSGLVVLTAGTSGTFNGPSGSNFVTGDEMLLYKWDLSGGFGDGILSNSTGALSFSGAWDEGDPLRLYWYPDLTIASTGPTTGMQYGYYSDIVGLDGSSPWYTPPEVANIDLKFFTSDAFFLPLAGGSNDPLAGWANHLVPAGVAAVPEPGTTFGLSLLLGSALQLRHRSRRRKH